MRVVMELGFIIGLLILKLSAQNSKRRRQAKTKQNYNDPNNNKQKEI